jgi:integrase
MAPNGQLSFADLDAGLPPPGAQLPRPQPTRTRASSSGPTDRAALAALETALTEARAAADDRPPLVVLSACLASFGAPTARPAPTAASLRQARDDWLRRLTSTCRSESAHRAYRNAIDDLLTWSEPHGRDPFEEATIVDYLTAYQERAQPAPATYYRRFVLIRRFLRWVSRRDGVPDPFLDLEPPPKPRQERDWLEHDEFRRLLEAAGHPERNLPGLAERDRLALITLVTTGLRRSELCGLDWRDLDLDAAAPTLLVRRGKGGKPRRQPLPAGLAAELRALRTARALHPRRLSSADSTAAVSSKRSLPRSSAVQRGGRDSRNTSRRTRSATQLRPGCAKRSETRDSWPNTSDTPTSQPSAATRTSAVRNSSQPLDASRTLPRTTSRPHDRATSCDC